MKRLGHAIETLGQRSELVVGTGYDARPQITLLHPREPGLQAGQRIEDEQVGGVEQGDRTADGEGHHHELHGVQDRRQAGQVFLDSGDEAVDAAHERVGLLRGALRTRCRQSAPGGSQHIPLALHHVKGLLGGVIVRNEERPRRVTRAKHPDAAVELFEQRTLLPLVGALQRLRQAPGLHAHAAGFVDCGRATFKLPGHPQREADRGEGHQQQRGADRPELGEKNSMTLACRHCTGDPTRR